MLSCCFFKKIFVYIYIVFLGVWRFYMLMILFFVKEISVDTVLEVKMFFGFESLFGEVRDVRVVFIVAERGFSSIVRIISS